MDTARAGAPAAGLQSRGCGSARLEVWLLQVCSRWVRLWDASSRVSKGKKAFRSFSLDTVFRFRLNSPLFRSGSVVSLSSTMGPNSRYVPLDPSSTGLSVKKLSSLQRLRANQRRSCTSHNTAGKVCDWHQTGLRYSAEQTRVAACTLSWRPPELAARGFQRSIDLFSFQQHRILECSRLCGSILELHSADRRQHLITTCRRTTNGRQSSMEA